MFRKVSPTLIKEERKHQPKGYRQWNEYTWRLCVVPFHHTAIFCCRQFRSFKKIWNVFRSSTSTDFENVF